MTDKQFVLIQQTEEKDYFVLVVNFDSSRRNLELFVGEQRIPLLTARSQHIYSEPGVKDWTPWVYNWSAWGNTSELSTRLFSHGMHIILDITESRCLNSFMSNPIYYLDKHWSLNFDVLSISFAKTDKEKNEN